MQAEAIYKALSRKAPSHKADFTQNFAALKKDLLDLDTRMSALSAINPELPIIASHPIYQYMARRYNMNIKMMMWEPDEDPGEKEWKQLQKIVQDHPAGWMIWEEEPLPSSVKRLEKLNIHSLIFSPCFARPQQGDFLSVMQENIKNIETVFN